MQAQDLINAAMRTAGIYSAGEGANPTEVNDALTSLNQMLDSWSAERLLAFSVQRLVFALPANNTGSWQIGPNGADFPSYVRPTKIEQAGLILNENNAAAVELPLRILTQQEWANTRVKQLPSPVPTAIYCEYDASYLTIYTWPAMLVGGVVALYAWMPFTQFEMLANPVQLPPGYFEALQYNLAVRLAIEYGQTPSPLMIQLATELKDRLKLANNTEYLTRCDGYHMGQGYGFNIYSGETE